MENTRARITMPALPLEGGCQCGAVRYRITGAPLLFLLCHCTECQRHTSSAYSESLRVRSADFSLQGTVAETGWIAESGNRRRGLFCPSCGVRLVHPVNEEVVVVKAGTLDDVSWLIPAGHIWARSRQPFIQFGADELVYDRAPDDNFAALNRRWREMLGQ